MVLFFKQVKNLILCAMINNYSHVKVQTGHKTITYQGELYAKNILFDKNPKAKCCMYCCLILG